MDPLPLVEGDHLQVVRGRVLRVPPSWATPVSADGLVTMTNVRAWGSGVSVLPDTIDIQLLLRSERSWAVPDQPLFVVGDSAYVFLDSVVAAPHPTLRYGRYSKWDIVGDSLYLRGVDVVCGDAMISTGRSALDLESRLNAR